MMNPDVLKPGDGIEIIAPASKCSQAQLQGLATQLTRWGLTCHIAPDIFGDDFLFANTDERRLALLYNALTNPNTKAVICARGGWGSMRLIPALHHLPKPAQAKLFIGLSDITALQLFLMQEWQWPVIHGGITVDKTLPSSLDKLESLLFGRTKADQLQVTAMNPAARALPTLTAPITGGNLSLAHTSIGTLWHMNAQDKIIFLEEVNERGYQVDRKLVHLAQAGVFQGAKAILFGDFIDGLEPDGSSLVEAVLNRFAQDCPLPVYRITGMGHGAQNDPLPLGVLVTLKV